MLTSKQDQKYWRIWAALCANDLALNALSSAAKSERRREMHRSFGLPQSHKHWDNSQFSRWISRTAPLLDQVDIRDRDRENAVWTIERLRDAFITLIGHDYAHHLMADWRDTTDLDNFPLEGASKLDLINFRNTLKNRLGRIIQRIKDGELAPGPACPNLPADLPQADIIHALINRQPVVPRPAAVAATPAPAGRRQYDLGGNTTFNGQRKPVAPPVKPTPRQPAAPAAAAPVPGKRKYCTHATPAPLKKPTTPQPDQNHTEPDPF